MMHTHEIKRERMGNANLIYPKLPSEDPANSVTLHKNYYTDQAIFEQEKQDLFYKTWHYGGWVGDLKEPGQYLTTSLFDQNVIIIRSQDGELAGFYNVCKHRGHTLLNGTGRVTRITCPYHSWVYDLKGQLKHARASETTPALDMDSVQLTPINVDVVAGLFVFFNLDVDAPALEPELSEFVADLEREIPELRDLVRSANPREEPDPETGTFLDNAYPVEANWKIVMENFLECYHCKPGHPGVEALFALNDLTYEGHNLWAKQKSSVAGIEGGKQIFWTLFPNLVLSTVVGEKPYLSMFVFAVPDGPTRTLPGYGGYYQLPDDDGTRILKQNFNQVGAEDKALCEAAQRGMRSLGYEQGVFMYTPDNSECTEEASHAFSRFVMRYVSKN